MEKPEKNLFYISVVSLISCIAVVALHANGDFWTYSNDLRWIKANIIECFFFPAVPLFFMISGVTLIDFRKRYSLRVYAEKRLKRAFIPFILWSGFAMVYCLHYGKIALGDLTFSNIISSVFNAKYNGVYWFFPPLFTIYILIPFIGLIPEEKRKKPFFYMTVIAFGFSVIKTLCQLIGIEFNNSLNNGLFNYSIYILIGYYVNCFPISKKRRIAIYLLGVSGFMIHLFGAQILSFKAGRIIDTFKGYTNFPCILHATALFVFFKYFPWKKLGKWFEKAVNILSPVTLGVYLMHWFVLNQLKIRFGFPDINRVSFKALAVIITFTLCAVLTKIIKKIPFLQNIC